MRVTEPFGVRCRIPWMPDETDLNRIDASPTKEFFISMRTRDVQLTRAIIDLIDNCVDGANRFAFGWTIPRTVGARKPISRTV